MFVDEPRYGCWSKDKVFVRVRFFCSAERTNGCDTGRAAEDTTYVLLLIFLVSATAFTLH